jgi:hypothetical protein
MCTCACCPHEIALLSTIGNSFIFYMDRAHKIFSCLETQKIKISCYGGRDKIKQVYCENVDYSLYNLYPFLSYTYLDYTLTLID